MSKISFEISRTDAATIRAIVKRMLALNDRVNNSGQLNQKVDLGSAMDLEMDLVACHANGTPLDLVKLATADDFNLAHDMLGIRRHLNRITGELDGRFLPRCARSKITTPDAKTT